MIFPLQGIRKIIHWGIRLFFGIVFFLVVIFLYHTQFEPFREQYPEYFTWLPAHDISEKVTVIEKNEQTTVTESDFVPKLIVNAQNIGVTVVSSGGGFALQTSGFFVTNDGVIAVPIHGISLEKDVQYTVFSVNGESFSATLIGSDSFTETAFLRAEKKNSSTVTIAPTDAFSSGRNILLIGKSSEGNAPVAQTSSLSEWAQTTNLAKQVVGSSEKYEGVGRVDHGIRATEGLAVVTYQGELLGMTRIKTMGSESETIVLPIRTIMIALDVVSRGDVSWARPFLGVSYVSLTPELSKMYGLDTERGAWVSVPGTTATVVLFGSPAYLSGIRQGDIIVSVNGKEITPESPLSNQIAEFHPGDKVTLTLLRDGSKKDILVTLGKAV